MRVIAALAALVLAVACSRGAPAVDGAARAEAQARAVETQEAFIARCTRETIASNPQSRAWAQSSCEQTWEIVAAAGPLADTILAAAPETAVPADLTALRARLTAIRWSARATPPALANGTLRDLAVSLNRAPPALSFAWQSNGQTVPYDLAQALRGRGATLTLVACQSYGGPYEVVRLFRVEAPGKAPFGLSIYAVDAATATSYAAFTASLDLSGAAPTLARARASGGDWAPRCPE